MNDSDGTNRRRRIEGSVHALVGLSLLLLLLSVVANGVARNVSVYDVLGILFFASVGAALLGIGVAQLRGRRHPSWIVRSALYVSMIACMPGAIQVAREAVAKQRAINNLRQLGEAVRQYEANFKIAPKPSISSEVERPDNDLPQK